MPAEGRRLIQGATGVPWLMQQYGASEEKLQLMNHECQEMVEQAVEFARASPDPSPDQLLAAVYSSGGSE